MSSFWRSQNLSIYLSLRHQNICLSEVIASEQWGLACLDGKRIRHAVGQIQFGRMPPLTKSSVRVNRQQRLRLRKWNHLNSQRTEQLFQQSTVLVALAAAKYDGHLSEGHRAYLPRVRFLELDANQFETSFPKYDGK